MCGCNRFYLKDPDDEYDIHEFDLRGGVVVFTARQVDGGGPDIQGETETYCDNCSWHGKFKELINPGGETNRGKT
jgi:hypothetical protein